MYLRVRPSTSFDADSYTAEDVANQIRELVRAITTPNFDKNTLNPAAYDPVTSQVLDTNFGNWVFTSSTRDTNGLGSGAGQSAPGDAWVVSNGAKNIEFSIIHRESLGENIRIAVSKNGEPHSYWINPLNKVTINTNANNDSLTIGEWVLNRYKTF
jgi:hypothetical protein